jgi:hypothetical protein
MKGGDDMSDIDQFYIKNMLFLNDANKEDIRVKKLLVKLIQDVYKGYANESVIRSVIDFCEISEGTWDAYLYAYKLYKKYQNPTDSKESMKSKSVNRSYQ